MDSQLIAQGVATIASDPKLYSLLVIRHDTIVYEGYFNGNNSTDSHNVYSTSKSMISALIGIAIDKGFIKGVDQKISDIMPQYFTKYSANDARRNITVENLLTMTAGINWVEDSSEYTMTPQDDRVQKTLDLGLAHPPGSTFNYSTGVCHLASAVLQNATGMNTADFAETYLFGPLNINAEHWGRDNQGIYCGGYNVYLTPREMARFGLLYEHGGNLDGNQIVPEWFVDDSLSPHVLNAYTDTYDYGYYWWLRQLDGYDTYIAWGWGGQFIYIIPDLDLMFVSTENTAGPDGVREIDVNSFLSQYVIPSITDQSAPPLFYDSFENGEWNGLWVQDGQSDWYSSKQRATVGSASAEVDGPASNATLTMAQPVALSSSASATLTFDWLIESGFDAGEYLALDFTSDGTTWHEIARLRGNVDQEDAWHNETISIDSSYLTDNFKIRFRATASQADEDADVDNVRIVGVASGDSPEIDVRGNSVSIVDGDMTPSTIDGTDFGSQDVTTGSLTRTFTIANTGAAALNLNGSPLVQISGANAGDFTVSAQPISSVTAGGSTTFTLNFNPSASGTRTATVTIINNDSNENPYNFTVQGTGTSPEIDVRGNNVSISDGDVTPSTADGTDFGTQNVTGGSLTRTFTIANTGTGVLNLTGSPLVQISGANAGDFSVGQPTSSSVAAGQSITFTITFDPTASGTRSATVTILNSDDDKNPYIFSIQGTGTTATGMSYYLSMTDGGTLASTNGAPSVSFADADILKLTVSANGQYQYELYFDGSDVGLTTSNEDIDAFALLPDGSIIVSTVGSFSVPVTGGTLSGNGEDLLRFVPATLGATTSGTWSMYFDGSDVGLSGSAENIDAVSVLADGRVLVSTTGAVSVSGVSGQDEDLLAFTPTALGSRTSGSWSMYFDGSDVGLSTNNGEDVNAIYVREGSGNPTLFLSTTGNFAVTGASGANEDAVAFAPTSLGGNTAGTFGPGLAFDGSVYGLAAFNVDGIYLAPASSAVQATAQATVRADGGGAVVSAVGSMAQMPVQALAASGIVASGLASSSTSLAGVAEKISDTPVPSTPNSPGHSQGSRSRSDIVRPARSAVAIKSIHPASHLKEAPVDAVFGKEFDSIFGSD